MIKLQKYFITMLFFLCCIGTVAGMPVVDFTADNTTVSPGDIVQFTRDENDPMEIGAYPVCSTHNLPVEDYT